MGKLKRRVVGVVVRESLKRSNSWIYLRIVKGCTDWKKKCWAKSGMLRAVWFGLGPEEQLNSLEEDRDFLLYGLYPQLNNLPEEKLFCCLVFGVYFVCWSWTGVGLWRAREDQRLKCWSLKVRVCSGFPLLYKPHLGWFQQVLRETKQSCWGVQWHHSAIINLQSYP